MTMLLNFLQSGGFINIRKMFEAYLENKIISYLFVYEKKSSFSLKFFRSLENAIKAMFHFVDLPTMPTK